MGSVIQGTAMNTPKDALKLRTGVTLPVDAGAVNSHHQAGDENTRSFAQSSPFGKPREPVMASSTIAG